MSTAYDGLVQRLQRISAIGQAAKLLQWDQETYMPRGGAEARAVSLGALRSVGHDMFTDPDVGRLLSQAEKEETDEKRVALLRETRIEYDRATKVPSELVEALSKASSRGLEAWKDARAKSDYAAFLPHLQQIVDLRRKYAAHIDPSKDAYEVLFQEYEPWIPLADARRSLARLRDGLKPILDKAAAAPRPREDALAGPWPEDKQRALSMDVLRGVGYDFHHGRLDVSAHPFTEGNVYDARVTTRFGTDDLVSGLLGTIHEAGHAMYEQGLPKEDFGTPLGEAQGLVIHESQSRLWENHVGRSRAFWEWALPQVRAHFPNKAVGASVDAAWVAANQVRPSLIRVEADELTYHMHIALRFEIEEEMISGRLDLRDVPSAWNERMAKYLGLTPPNDAQGCMQDIHWALASLGYFPTYSLGSMLSAQLFETYERAQPDAEAQLARGEFAPLLSWLRENVHRHGRRYTTSDLIQRATGRELTPDALLQYAAKKYDAVWSATR